MTTEDEALTFQAIGLAINHLEGKANETELDLKKLHKMIAYLTELKKRKEKS